MRGAGHLLSPPLGLPPLDAVLVFPGAAVATAAVFAAFAISSTPRVARAAEAEIPRQRAALVDFLARQANDLEPAAISIAPVIAEARALLEDTQLPRFVRMTGSGSAVFAICDSAAQSIACAGKIRASQANWWTAATTLR
jgi:4-diphosphocytidyl-2-C-methyl-D-erythritol kinase